jgi:hypothetical protein
VGRSDAGSVAADKTLDQVIMIALALVEKYSEANGYTGKPVLPQGIVEVR